MAGAAVTGMGVIGSFGCGVGALAEALRTSRPVLSEVDRSAGYHLPESARTRMGLASSHKNVLLRLVIRDLNRTLTAAEANEIRDQVYAALHEGSAHEWTNR